MGGVLRPPHGSVSFFPAGHSATIDATRLASHEAPSDVVARMRASFWVLGPVLARLQQARIPQPGGCNIGARPIDLHLKGLQALGADLDVNHGIITALAPQG